MSYILLNLSFLRMLAQFSLDYQSSLDFRHGRVVGTSRTQRAVLPFRGPGPRLADGKSADNGR